MELAIILFLIVVYALWAYNSMIKLRNQVKEAWSDIDVQLKRRYNLIPNIVETVKGYAAQEETVLVEVTEARAKAINAGTVQEQGVAENMLSGALKSLFAVTENYPDLKSNENFMQLQNELVDTEDKIQASRRFYNGVVRDFNTKIQQIPAKFIASIAGFKAAEFFEIEDEEQRENVEVNFSKEEAPKVEAPAAEPKTEEAPAPDEQSIEQLAVTPVEEPKAEEPTPAVEVKPEEPAAVDSSDEAKPEESPTPATETPAEVPTDENPAADVPEQKTEEPQASEAPAEQTDAPVTEEPTNAQASEDQNKENQS